MAQSADINGLLCPITCEVMRDPVILTGDGQTYERVAIEQWLRKGGQSSPATGASLGGNCMLIANRALRNTIDEMCSNGLLKDADIFVNQADGVYGGGGGGGGAQMKFGGCAAMPAVANLGAACAAAHPKGSPPTQTTFEAPPKTDGGSSATLPNSARPAAAAAAASGVAWNRTRVPVRDPSDPPGCSRRWQRRSQPPPPALCAQQPAGPRRSKRQVRVHAPRGERQVRVQDDQALNPDDLLLQQLHLVRLGVCHVAEQRQVGAGAAGRRAGAGGRARAEGHVPRHARPAAGSAVSAAPSSHVQ